MYFIFVLFSCWSSAGADDHLECVEKLHKVSKNAAKVCT